MSEVVVIGGGAGGMAAAISAAQQGARVSLLEGTERVGQKILVTGNGRCNITNMHATPERYNSPAFVAPVLERFDGKRVRDWFKQLGLLTVEEAQGRVYPLSNTATSVVDVLRAGCDRAGVNTITGFPVDVIVKDGDRFYVASPNGGRGSADALIVATGGGTKLLGQMGHGLAPFRPVLCSLATETDVIRGLSGVRAKVKVSAYDSDDSPEPYFVEEGEVLFRDYGVSGIVIFNLSRHAQEGQPIAIDFLPDMGLSGVEDLLRRRMEHLGPVTRSLDGSEAQEIPSNAQLLQGMFHPRVITAVLRAARVKPSAAAAVDTNAVIARAVKGMRLVCTGPGDVKHAQVTRGGALVEDFDPQTMESRRVPRLYAVGETLNVDGECGGFNLHWAWASGLVAGRAAARR